MPIADLSNFFDADDVPTATAAHVGRILDRHEAGQRRMSVVAGVNVPSQLIGSEPAIVSTQQANRASRVGRDTSTFIKIDVRQLMTNDFVTRLYMNPDADLVGHRAAGAKQGGLHPEHLRRLSL